MHGTNFLTAGACVRLVGPRCWAGGRPFASPPSRASRDPVKVVRSVWPSASFLMSLHTMPGCLIPLDSTPGTSPEEFVDARWPAAAGREEEVEIGADEVGERRDEVPVDGVVVDREVGEEDGSG